MKQFFKKHAKVIFTALFFTGFSAAIIWSIPEMHWGSRLCWIFVAGTVSFFTSKSVIKTIDS